MKAQTQKKVQVLTTYTFNHIDRVLFVVASSKGDGSTYNTCFSNGRGSCTCDGHEKYHRDCYHMAQLRPRYEAIKAERAAKREAALTEKLFPEKVQAAREAVALTTQLNEKLDVMLDEVGKMGNDLWEDNSSSRETVEQHLEATWQARARERYVNTFDPCLVA